MERRGQRSTTREPRADPRQPRPQPRAQHAVNRGSRSTRVVASVQCVGKGEGGEERREESGDGGWVMMLLASVVPLPRGGGTREGGVGVLHFTILTGRRVNLGGVMITSGGDDCFW